MLSIRDPVHGFIRADPLEAALITSRSFQRLRFIHQLGFTFLVYPGAEHSRFGHALGAMHLAGRVYDALSAKSKDRDGRAWHSYGLEYLGPGTVPKDVHYLTGKARPGEIGQILVKYTKGQTQIGLHPSASIIKF